MLKTKRIINFIEKYDLILVFLVAFLSRIVFFNRLKLAMWDAAVYLMNAKWFAGEKIFMEIGRAPLLPFLLSPFMKLGMDSFILFKVISIIFAAVSVLLVYMLAKEVFGKKSAILSAAILIVVPIHLFWSPAVYTEIPASVFLMLSLLFIWKGLKNEKYIYLSAFFCGLAFLTRYPLGVLLPSIILFLFLQKKLNVKKLVLIPAIFALVCAPWLVYNQINYGDAFYSIKEGIRWQGPVAEPVYYYITTLPASLSFALILVAFGVGYSLLRFKEPKMQLFLIFLLLFFGYLSYTSHKEARYFLPAIPVLIIFSSYFAEKINWKKWKYSIFALLIVTFLTAGVSTMLYQNCESIVEASSGLEGTAASTYWPLTAYYGSVNVRAMPAEKADLESFVREANITYVLTSTEGEWPPYAADFEFFSNQSYLEQTHELTDKCQTYKVYKVKL